MSGGVGVKKKVFHVFPVAKHGLESVIREIIPYVAFSGIPYGLFEAARCITNWTVFRLFVYQTARDPAPAGLFISGDVGFGLRAPPVTPK